MSTIIESLQKRYAVKKFDATKSVSSQDISEIKHALQLTASSYGLQAYKMAIISNRALQEELMTVSWNQAQIRDASHIVLFIAKEEVSEEYLSRFVALHRSVRRTSEDKLERLGIHLRQFVGKMDTVQTHEWSARQTYIAIGNLLTVLAIKGIDSCPIEGIVKDEWDRILGLKGKGLRSVACVAIGYRAEDDATKDDAKLRLPLDELFVELPLV